MRGGFVTIAAIAAVAGALAACTNAPPACNPFFPVPRGASWVFQEAQQRAGVVMERSVSVASVADEGRVTTATLEQRVHAVGQPETAAGRATTTVRCAGGAVQTSIVGGAASAAGGAQANATVKAELPGLPPADKLVAGYQWRSEGRIETSDANGSQVTQIARESQVDGVFPVKVAAGDFPDALRVASVETLRLGPAAGDREAKQEIREWYVRGVGLVRRDTRIPGADQAASVEELVQFSGVRAER
ncbi:MAG TPA: hypothetical protein VFD92_28380 [Candidatus Binatia bacterium]|nr:hypothetical protein [Candidatus Binatia bacterium]